PALTRGGALPDARRDEIAEQVARYAAVSPEYVKDWNLAVPVSSFRKELLRDQGYTVGRLDSRYRGVDRT
ncbi:MAG: carboxypeptidase, partial [Gemmatimonadota bacterium]